VQRLTDTAELVEAHWPETALLAAGADVLRLPVLESLILSGKHFPTDTLEPTEADVLSHSAVLEGLTLDGATLDGSVLAKLFGRCPALVLADLAGCDLDDDDVAALVAARPQLREIRLGGVPPRPGHQFTSGRLTAGVLNRLAGLAHLRSVALRGLRLSDGDVADATYWNRLVSVDLGQTRVGDDTATRLGGSPMLREVSLDGTAVTDAGAGALFTERVEAVNLSRTAVSGAGLMHVGSTPRLARLELSGVGIDDGFAEVITRLPALRHLDVSDTHVSDRVATAAAELPELKTVNFSGTQITAAGIARLADSSATDVDIRGIRIFADSVERFAQSRFRTVKLSVGDDWEGLGELASEVTLEGEAPRSGCAPPRLVAMTLRGDLSGAAAETLAAAPRLRSLTVTDTVGARTFVRASRGSRCSGPRMPASMTRRCRRWFPTAACRRSISAETLSGRR
jgi:hypothetical protein